MGVVTLEDDLEASKIQTLTEASDNKKGSWKQWLGTDWQTVAWEPIKPVMQKVIEPKDIVEAQEPVRTATQAQQVAAACQQETDKLFTGIKDFFSSGTSNMCKG